MDSTSRLRHTLATCLRSIAMDSDLAIPLQQLLAGLDDSQPALAAALPYALGVSLRIFGFAQDRTEPTAVRWLEAFQANGSRLALRVALAILCLDRLGVAAEGG